ncbi:Tyrosine-protein kinase ptk [Aquimixticola soesokkakensis]|uniref:Tyrosine-protein kinase ptk n=1 Tax=Aquimixticola soesokkakensis TaxID=1519096 RepID=A0A1Y5RBC7_9RHOB|nr:polysaccharide biosynthesis tyrosine autokinase [Aquimixticola soesokkakensis]SLN13328.1 Tyrosine-protein kinase ptk [Aquimixticola soesokkakensis]
MNNSDFETIDLKSLFSIFKRQSRLLFATIVLFLVVALGYIFITTPTYTASTLVIVDTSRKNILDEDTFATNSSTDNARLESEVEILKSDAVALETIRRLGLIQDPEFGPKLGTVGKLKVALGLSSSSSSAPAMVNDALSRFRNSVSVRRRGLTYVLAISATSADRDKAAVIANGLSKTYIDLQVQSKVNAALGSRDVLQNQLEAARDRLAASEDQLDTYIDTNLERLERESGSTAIAQLRETLADSSSRIAQIEDRQSQAQALLVSGDWSSLADELNDQALTALNAQRAQLAARLSDADPQSQTGIDLQNGLDRLTQSLAERGQASVSGLQAEISQIETQTSAVRDTIRTELLSGDLSSATLAEIFALQQEADIAQRQYSTLLSRMRDLEAQALVQVADSRIVSEAIAPRAASFPNRKLILSAALILALAVGVGLALLNEYFLGGITSTSQLGNVVPARVAGAIPLIELKPEQLSIADNIIDEPLSVYAESVRKLRAVIDRAAMDRKTEGALVIMITSSIPAEGKTSLSLALARTYALAGKSTLLIDADLRKPMIHRQLGLEPQRGFLEYLRDPQNVGDDESFYDADPKSHLGTILGRQRADVPTDQLLLSNTFESLMRNSRSAMDVVIVDTSPLVPVVDARYIAPYADIALEVVRFGVTGQGDLRNSYTQITESVRPGVPVLTVLNLDEGTTRGYRYDGYYADYTTS